MDFKEQVSEEVILEVGKKVAGSLMTVAATAIAAKTGYDQYIDQRTRQDGEFVNGFFSDNIHRMSADLPSVKDEAELNDQWGWLWAIGNSMSRVEEQKESVFSPKIEKQINMEPNQVEKSVSIEQDSPNKETVITKTENSKSTDISPKGAKGRWQITKPALEDFNNYNNKNYNFDSLSDEQNEEVGSWYYNKRIPVMLEAIDVPVTEVNKAIAYNAGASRAKDYKKLPKETVNYIIKRFSDEIPNVDVKMGVDVFSRDRKDAENMQRFLKEKGFYEGKIDNIWGAKSKSAFIKWLEEKNAE